MNWTEQTQAMLRSWTDTQKKLWEDWTGAARPPGPQGGGGWSAWLGQWQKAAGSGMNGIPLGAGEIPRAVAERLFAGEQVFVRFVEVALGVLKVIAPKIDAGEDWADLLRRQIAQFKDEMTRTPSPWYSPEAAATMAKDLPELWKLYLQEAEKMAAPWVHSFRAAHGHLGEAVAGDQQAVVRMFNVFMDTFETSAGRLTAVPAVGYTREFQEKVARAFETWVDVRRSEVEFRTELVNAGFRALEGLVRELVERGERGEKIETFRGLFDLWVTIAEKTYFEIANTESFAEIQGRLVNAAMQYRIREREITETVLKGWHLPTRRELDDAYRHLHELKAEVRNLRRELAHLKKTSKPPASPQNPAVGAVPNVPRRKKATRVARKEG
jgi:class III poly(R)-hydroxyalkanoic acid synthase PhaE subunit